MNRLQVAEQFRRILQIFTVSHSDEQAIEVPALFDLWKPGQNHKGGDLFTSGTNSVGDPQLYRATPVKRTGCRLRLRISARPSVWMNPAAPSGHSPPAPMMPTMKAMS